MKNSTTAFALLVSALTFIPTLAHAHPGHGAGFTAGMAHPLAGLDHVLAMLAVGLWAAQLGGRARWAVPAAFVGVMALGSALGMAGVTMPMVEPAILCSVVILGLLVSMAVRVPLAASLALVGAFAAVHGLVHGAELPVNASGLSYTGGFALATAALHGAGLAFGAGLQRMAATGWVRVAGAAVAIAGAMLAAS
jgi:urease accessory protein